MCVPACVCVCVRVCACARVCGGERGRACRGRHTAPARRCAAARAAGPGCACGARGAMARALQANVRLLIGAGAAKPAPPVGPALGQQGVNIMAFCKVGEASVCVCACQSYVVCLIRLHEPIRPIQLAG